MRYAIGDMKSPTLAPECVRRVMISTHKKKNPMKRIREKKINIKSNIHIYISTDMGIYLLLTR